MSQSQSIYHDIAATSYSHRMPLLATVAHVLLVTLEITVRSTLMTVSSVLVLMVARVW